MKRATFFNQKFLIYLALTCLFFLGVFNQLLVKQISFFIFPNVYNDTKAVLEDELLFRDNSEAQFFKNKNYWYPTNVRIVISPWSICTYNQGSDLDILFYVFIRVSSFEVRDAIRQTYASRKRYPTVNFVFIIGRSVDHQINSRVLDENNKHGDIIQGDFIDAYRNLSFKSLIQWRWTVHNCRNAKYYGKLDDDVFLNTKALLQFLRNETLFHPPNRSFIGEISVKSYVMRNKDDPLWGKYYTRFEEWSEPFYKPYAIGCIYIMTNDMPRLLYNTSFTTQGFWIDDVYAGILSSNIDNVTFVEIGQYYLRNSMSDLKALTRQYSMQQMKEFFAFYPLNNLETYEKLDHFFQKFQIN